MSRNPLGGPPSLPWPTTYLIVAALSFGLLAGIRYGLPQSRHRLELVISGIVVGMFTATALLHWYDVADRSPLRRW